MWLTLFMIYPEFRHLPWSERWKAAYFAQNQALRHWQVIVTIVFLCASVAGFSVLDITFHISDIDGNTGAFVGFLLGITVLTGVVYRYGLPYYRDALRQNRQL